MTQRTDLIYGPREMRRLSDDTIKLKLKTDWDPAPIIDGGSAAVVAEFFYSGGLAVETSPEARRIIDIGGVGASGI